MRRLRRTRIPEPALNGSRSGGNLEAAALYQVIADQMRQHDLLMWQVPVLSFTAQAFLLTVVLGADSARVARICAATLAILSSLLSMQLMAKHRWYARVEREWLARFEKSNDVECCHAPPAELALSVGVPLPKYPARYSSYQVWQIGLAVFGLVSVFCLIISIVKPDLF